MSSVNPVALSAWRAKRTSAPQLAGSKDTWRDQLVVALTALSASETTDATARPEWEGPTLDFGEYAKALAPAKLVERVDGIIRLTDDGRAWLQNPSGEHLVTLLHRRIQLIGEMLVALEREMTVEELLAWANERFRFGWTTAGGIRTRISWLSALKYVEDVGEYRWRTTDAGRQLAARLEIADPEALFADHEEEPVPELQPAPPAIEQQLDRLRDEPALHGARRLLGYIPLSGAGSSIDSLRRLAEVGAGGIDRAEFDAICTAEFKLSGGSLSSVLTTLRATGIYRPIGGRRFESTESARAWLETGSDTDLVRLLHANIKFVGELLDAALEGLTTPELRRRGQERYRVNDCRPIIRLLTDAGLLVPTIYLNVEVSPTGQALLAELPLATDSAPDSAEFAPLEVRDDPAASLAERIELASRDPFHLGEISGRGFEMVVAEAFEFLGVETKLIGGAGDTDVLLSLHDRDGTATRVIVDTKAKSGGAVGVGDISEVSITNHRRTHDAKYVVVVGPSFTDGSLRTWADESKVTLSRAATIADLVLTHSAAPLAPSDVLTVLADRDPAASLDRIGSERRHEFAVARLTVSVLVDAVAENDAEIGLDRSVRDIYMATASVDPRPTTTAIGSAMQFLVDPRLGLVEITNPGDKPEHLRYQLTGAPLTAARRLRAWADAIEAGATGSRPRE